VASEITVAVIGGVAGLVTGTAGSLTAPWAQWGVEQRRLRRQRSVDLIAEWRAGIDALRAAEDEAAPRIPFPGRTRETRGAGTSWLARIHLIRPRLAIRSRTGTKP
jgi:hypothetical protein